MPRKNRFVLAADLTILYSRYSGRYLKSFVKIFLAHDPFAIVSFLQTPYISLLITDLSFDLRKSIARACVFVMSSAAHTISNSDRQPDNKLADDIVDGGRRSFILRDRYTRRWRSSRQLYTQRHHQSVGARATTWDHVSTQRYRVRQWRTARKHCPSWRRHR